MQENVDLNESHQEEGEVEEEHEHPVGGQVAGEGEDEAEIYDEEGFKEVFAEVGEGEEDQGKDNNLAKFAFV